MKTRRAREGCVCSRHVHGRWLNKATPHNSSTGLNNDEDKFKISQYHSSNISLHLSPQLAIIILGLVFGNSSDIWSGLLILFLEYSCLYSISEMGLQYSLCILFYSPILWCICFCFDVSEIRMQGKSCHWPDLCQDLMLMASAGQVWNVPMSTFLSETVILPVFW